SRRNASSSCFWRQSVIEARADGLQPLGLEKVVEIALIVPGKCPWRNLQDGPPLTLPLPDGNIERPAGLCVAWVVVSADNEATPRRDGLDRRLGNAAQIRPRLESPPLLARQPHR